MVAQALLPGGSLVGSLKNEVEGRNDAKREAKAWKIPSTSSSGPSRTARGGSSQGESRALMGYRALSMWERLLTWSTRKVMIEEMGLDPRAATAMARKVATSIIDERGDQMLSWVARGTQDVV